MKRNVLLLSRSLLSLVVLAGCCTLALAADKKAKQPKQVKHPPLSAQEQYIACDECHVQNTPDLHEEWFQSRHGVAMVKCYQCHGTFETFRVTPTRQDCAVCHENMIKKCPQDKACWQCHPAHSFKAKK